MRVDDVFHAERQAVEQTRRSVEAQAIAAARFFDRAIGIEVDECVNDAVARGNALEACRGQRLGGDPSWPIAASASIASSSFGFRATADVSCRLA